jgi:hypothetical protein
MDRLIQFELLRLSVLLLLIVLLCQLLLKWKIPLVYLLSDEFIINSDVLT